MNKSVAFVLVVTLVIVVNYLTDFFFAVENFTGLWLFGIAAVLPGYLAFFMYTLASESDKKYMLFHSFLALSVYLATYFVPFMLHFDFVKNEFEADGHTKALMAALVVVGTMVLVVFLIVGQVRLLTVRHTKQ